MTAAKPIPYTVDELDALFILDREHGLLIRRKATRGPKREEIVKAAYRYVSIAGVQYFEHRLIWMLVNRQFIPSGMDVDHINQNKLDNTPENLRLATTAQNSANTGMRRNNSTGFKGVFLDKGKFRAKIKSNGNQRFLGSYSTAEAAAAAYDSAALAAFGEYAMTNARMGFLAVQCASP